MPGGIDLDDFTWMIASHTLPTQFLARTTKQLPNILHRSSQSFQDLSETAVIEEGPQNAIMMALSPRTPSHEHYPSNYDSLHRTPSKRGPPFTDGPGLYWAGAISTKFRMRLVLGIRHNCPHHLTFLST